MFDTSTSNGLRNAEFLAFFNKTIDDIFYYAMSCARDEAVATGIVKDSYLLFLKKWKFSSHNKKLSIKKLLPIVKNEASLVCNMNMDTANDHVYELIQKKMLNTTDSQTNVFPVITTTESREYIYGEVLYNLHKSIWQLAKQHISLAMVVMVANAIAATIITVSLFTMQPVTLHTEYQQTVATEILLNKNLLHYKNVLEELECNAGSLVAMYAQDELAEIEVHIIPDAIDEQLAQEQKVQEILSVLHLYSEQLEEG